MGLFYGKWGGGRAPEKGGSNADFRRAKARR